MEIYLDANATTPVLAQARQAALQAMADDFGNPSSIHTTGLKARALMDQVRQRARQLLHTGSGQLLFTSGATEGIQTAVLSALNAWRERREQGQDVPPLLLYGATEHKAVPETLRHWNRLLGLGLHVQAIPVDTHGLHDLDFLRAHAAQAAMVCVMAANNETGVISNLAAVQKVLEECGSPAFFMVDGVQALGKLPLQLATSRIDYAPFSGHKLYAPKGIGLLYVREGAPFTPLLAGGGQESSLRSGTENMSGIAALGAVLQALTDGQSFRTHDQLQHFRQQLVTALHDAFPDIVFNAPLHTSLPTTLNFSVPGLPSKLLLDLFDAADLRVSGGSACSAAKAQPSFVLQAMGLPDWQTASAVRMSFGPAVDQAFIDEAAARIRACGEAARRNCLAGPSPEPDWGGNGLLQLSAAGHHCWLIADAATRCCIVIDPIPELLDRLERLLRCHNMRLLAIIDRRPAAESAGARAELRARLCLDADPVVDNFGWPDHTPSLRLADGRQALALLLGPLALARVDQGTAHPPVMLLGYHSATELPAADTRWAFVATHTTDSGTIQKLQTLLAPTALVCGSDDKQGPVLSLMTPPAASVAFAPPAEPQIKPQQLLEWGQQQPGIRLIDVREPYEQCLSNTPMVEGCTLDALPLSRFAGTVLDWLAAPQQPLVFFCRSGNRSLQAAHCLRQLGHHNSWSLQGGLALWEHVPGFMPTI